MLHYHLQPFSLTRHLWQTELRFTEQDARVFTLSLPNWLPGSYMIRDFARHIVHIEAECRNQPAELMQVNKNTWQGSGAGEWIIRYQVYAFDVSVRGAFLDTERGFFDGVCVFLRHNQRAEESCRVTIGGLPEHWDVATAMSRVDDAGKYAFQASGYRELIDYPCAMGQLLRLPFQAAGIDHEIVIGGYFADFDQARLVDDIRRICTAELALFADAPMPFTHYTFLLLVGNHLYGGLEHISSSSLMADRHALPQPGCTADEAYIGLLGLFSHEYFHAWNVKSVKPVAVAESDLNHEAYTRLLWAFEGITSYYDDLFLVRSGVIRAEQYLNLLARTATRVRQGAGRLVQSLADSSFTAWTKYYRQNENSPNATVSYYQQGALVALYLDMLIRRETQGQKSLDDVMRALYRDWQQRHQGLADGEWLALAEAATGLDLQAFQRELIDTAADVPLAEALQQGGVTLQWRALARSHGGACVAEWPAVADRPVTDFGARLNQAAPGMTLTQVFHSGSAEQAGLCAGDQLIALNHEIISDFAGQWARLAVGSTVTLHLIRDGLLLQRSLVVQAAVADTALLRIDDRHALQHWLTAPAAVHSSDN